MMIYLIFLLWIQTAKCETGSSRPCVLRDYGENKRVCVCNATYCDTVPRVNDIGKDEFCTFTSSRDGLRFDKQTGKFSQNPLQPGEAPGVLRSSPLMFTLNTAVKYQKIHGFGGTFTDSAGINILSLDEGTQDNLLRSYFSVEGLEYNLCRLPIAGTDFSTHPYSYDDGSPDPELEDFSLVMEDFKYKIPLYQRAQNMSERRINLVTATWSPPPWMKTSDDYGSFSLLKPEYYNVYARYNLRFLDEYKKINITFWAISTGNEPSNGLLPVKGINSLGWTPSTIANWTAHYFGPQLRSSEHNETLLLAYEDQRLYLPLAFDLMVAHDDKVLDYIDGIAIHWYWDHIIPAAVVQTLHDTYPSKFLLYTEASEGDKPFEKKVDIGSWRRGEDYMTDIIENMNVWVTGWIDWNLALDETGGPTYINNYVDSAILVNATAGEFYKQPMFYAIGHFSKFIERNAERVHLSPTEDTGVLATAVQNPDGRVVVVLINKDLSANAVTIQVPEKGWINLTLPPRSFTTLVYVE